MLDARVLEGPPDSRRTGWAGTGCYCSLEEMDDFLFERCSQFGRAGRGAPAHCLSPGRIAGLVAITPRVEPTFRAAHLLADDRNGGAVHRALNRALTTLLKVRGPGFTCVSLIAAS